MGVEQRIEKLLVDTIKKHGGHCWKFTSPGTAGVPDRIAILPHGKTIYIETKAPGQKPRPIQVRRHQQLQDLGHDVRIIDNPQQIKDLEREIHTTQLPKTSN